MTNPVSTERATRLAESYGLADVHLQLLSEVDCIVYRVTGSAGHGASPVRSFILKIYPAHKKDPANIAAEIEWLQALGQDTDLRVPRPIAATDGAIIQSVSIAETADWPAVLFSWVEGRSLDRELTPASLERIGRFVGTLHRHSQTWTGPGRRPLRTRTYTQRVFGWILSMDRPPTLSEPAWDVLVRAARHLEAETAAFGHDPDVFGFIHSDLYLSNFIFHGDDVGVIDFSDCAWGHYADDIASALVFLKYPWVGNFDHSREYERLRDSFFEGYQSIRALPARADLMIDTYFAARILLLLAYVHEARDHVAWVPACLARCEQFLGDYVDRGLAR